MKLTNLKITPKLGILVGVTLLGLCAAGVLAGYLMQREMLNARVDQTRAIVDMGAQPGARPAEAGRRGPDDQGGRACRVRPAAPIRMTFDKGAGYRVRLHRWTASPCWRPIPSRSDQNRMDVDTERQEAVARVDATASKANGSILLRYEYLQARRGRADPQVLLRGCRSPAANMYRRHRRLSRRSRRQDEADRLACSGSPFSASRWFPAASPG